MAFYDFGQLINNGTEIFLYFKIFFKLFINFPVVIQNLSFKIIRTDILITMNSLVALYGTYDGSILHVCEPILPTAYNRVSHNGLVTLFRRCYFPWLETALGGLAAGTSLTTTTSTATTCIEVYSALGSYTFTARCLQLRVLAGLVARYASRTISFRPPVLFSAPGLFA